MKKFLYFLIILSVNLYSQDKYKEVVGLIQNNQLDKAKSIVDQWAQSASTNPVDWQYRAAVYQAIYESPNNDVKNLDVDPLDESYNCIKKSIELDINKELIKTNLESLQLLSGDFIKKGMNEYNNGNYKQALKSFENTLEINNTPEIMNLDTIVYYHAALAALKLKNYNKAISYFKKLIVYNFNKTQMYLELANVYKRMNDKEMYEKTLLEGMEACNNNIKLIFELINFYMYNEDIENTIKYIEQALSIDPYNADLYYLRAYLYETSNEKDKAIEYYEKCLQNSPTHPDANYNLGVIYFNEGINLDKEAMTKTQKAKANEMYLKAISYFETVLKYSPDDIETVKILAKLYNFTNQPEKQKKMEDILLKQN